MQQEANGARGSALFPDKAACAVPSHWKNLWGLGQSAKLRQKCEGTWGCTFTPGAVFGGTCTSTAEAYKAHKLSGFSDLVFTRPHTRKGFLARLELPLRQMFRIHLLDASKQQAALTALQRRTNWARCAEELKRRIFHQLEFQDRDVVQRIAATLAAQQYAALRPDVTETALRRRLQKWRQQARGTYKGARELLRLRPHQLQALQAHFTARGWPEDLARISERFARQRAAAAKRRKALAFPRDLSPYSGGVYQHNVHPAAPMPTFSDLHLASQYNVTIQLRFINRFPDFVCLMAMSQSGISHATVVLTNAGNPYQTFEIEYQRSNAEQQGVHLDVVRTNTVF
jgi:hypothetical protein